MHKILIFLFLQEPFVFDIEGEMYEYRTRIHRMVEQFPPPGKHGDWQLLLHKMVSSYLVILFTLHPGYNKKLGHKIKRRLNSY
jgi:hypothetical protein